MAPTKVSAISSCIALVPLMSPVVPVPVDLLHQHEFIHLSILGMVERDEIMSKEREIVRKGIEKLEKQLRQLTNS